MMVATDDHDTAFFAEIALTGATRIYLVLVSGMERKRNRERKKEEGKSDELDAVETFSCVVSRRDSLT